MRKKSKYKPKPQLTNPLEFVLLNVMPVNWDKDSSIRLRASNHAAIDELAAGRGTKDHFQCILDAMNMTYILAKDGKGSDWMPEITAAQNAMRSLAERSIKIGRYTLTGPELTAINLAMEVHDAQLDACTIGEIGRAADYIAHRIHAKQMVVLPTIKA